MNEIRFRSYFRERAADFQVLDAITKAYGAGGRPLLERAWPGHPGAGSTGSC